MNTVLTPSADSGSMPRIDHRRTKPLLSGGTIPLGWLLLSLGFGACSQSGGPSDAIGPTPDAGMPDDGGPIPITLEFETEVVEGLGSQALVGDNATAAVGPEGLAAIAYGFVPAQTAIREVHFAIRTNGIWQTEKVSVPGARAPSGGDLVGLGFDFVGGIPHIAYLGGDDDDDPTIDFPSDLVLATNTTGSWVERTLVDVSTEAPGDCSRYCNQGGVVGSHPHLRADPDGTGFAVVYRDTHFGFGVDDYAESDVEVYVESGNVDSSVVDAERSGGAFGQITYLAGGGLAVAYNLEAPQVGEDRVGIWAAVNRSGTWTRRKVSSAETSARVGLGEAPDGTLYLAFYATDFADLVVARSTDDGVTWTTETVDSVGKTGLHPSLAFDALGRVLVAYTYCGTTADRDCPGRLGPNAEVRLARLEDGAWAIYPVDDGQGFGGVGYFTSVIVDGEGKIGIAFVDDRNGDLLFSREK